ncbi:polyisoprenyl-teichoic acid--peptidoglycan teichoic acid transferase TagU [Bacillus toyonensis]|uniref:polyisoprenyl-teichoic acid--peptidoglycan teichoic acid transferase TagU n=1 Tax=Bacillus toyonensis TaxID=155322 RepID=UPI000B42E7CD|nr:LytR family transcriptional regulator [Bacillus toyonensis]OTX26326.1 LytR family transcriptional regulator [Bacillus thuringiensis serovar malayensis]OUB07679.1 LytR family transcriptional regulator [Bacillus thuringiensis serovar shandongiensis]MBX0354652.1 LytR family transcriptional regulator [Bacillus toyonensis]MDM5258253.1 LytR family transcriptional regulator [Bacillus toyonensis]MEC2394760.1 LytR family transcriptional regulator [Bacillus toyonensis]
MKKKILFWILGIIGVLVIAGGVYAYTVYSNVSNTLNTVHKPLDRDKSDKRDKKVEISDNKPISILLMGVDQEDNGTGRSDSLMLFTLNPKTKSMKITSIPRDSYTEIVGKGKKDKINHAYAFGGIDMSVKTVENFLNVPVDHYIEVNMAGFRDIVDAVGGVDVNNDLEFTSRDQHFAKGNIHLNGETALKYTRMRYEDPRGDFGRQMRQRQVIQAVIKKGASVSSLASYGDVLKAIEKNVKTSLTQEQMFEIQKNYKDCMENSEEIQIPGDGHKAADGIWYYYVPDAAKQDITNKLRAHLELTK